VGRLSGSSSFVRQRMRMREQQLPLLQRRGRLW
jgi:hypothetical protein